MKFPVYNQQGEVIREVELPQAIETLKMNVGLIHQVVVAQQTNQRQATAHTKTRSQVRGGGRKPWKQKGTGQARHGSNRSPLWRGGGTVFGPLSVRNYAHKVNRKMKQRATAMALADKIRSQKVLWVEPLVPPAAKTKAVVELLDVWKAKVPEFSQFVVRNQGNTGYMLSSGYQPQGMRAFRNIPGVRFEDARNMNIRDIVAFPYLIIEAGALPQIARYFNEKSETRNPKSETNPKFQ